MRASNLLLLALAPLILLPWWFSAAQVTGEPGSKVRAYTNATIYPVSAPPIERGTLLMRGEIIFAVGTADEVEIPAGAEVIDATGKTIIPGLICTHSHIGAGSGADSTSPAGC